MFAHIDTGAKILQSAAALIMLHTMTTLVHTCTAERRKRKVYAGRGGLWEALDRPMTSWPLKEVELGHVCTPEQRQRDKYLGAHLGSASICAPSGFVPGVPCLPALSAAAVPGSWGPACSSDGSRTPRPQILHCPLPPYPALACTSQFCTTNNA